MLTDKERKYLDNKYALRSRGGDNALLGSVMRYIRKSRQILDPTKTFSVFETNGLIQLWLQTPACRFSKEGKCTICNYWSGQRIPGLIAEIEKNVSIPENIDTILVNTCGSCLDSEELTAEEQEHLFRWLNNQPVKDIILETHMVTLSEYMVRHVREMIPEKSLFFEIGQESTDKDVQFYSLNKPMSEKGRKIILNRIRSYGAKSIVNVIVGSPFLNREEQICDAVDSIRDLLQEGADYVMLFPVNIKPNTLVYFLYEKGMYAPVDGNMIIQVLNALPEELLPRVGVAWYGEHREAGVIPPYVPETDRMGFNEMLASYNDSESIEERKQHITRLLQLEKNWVSEYSRERIEGHFAERLDRAYQFLSERYGMRDEG